MEALFWLAILLISVVIDELKARRKAKVNAREWERKEQLRKRTAEGIEAAKQQQE